MRTPASFFVIEGGFEGSHDLEVLGAFFLDALHDDLGENFGIADGDFGSDEGRSHGHGTGFDAFAVGAVAGHAEGEGCLSVLHECGFVRRGRDEEGGGEEEGGDRFHDIVLGRY